MPAAQTVFMCAKVTRPSCSVVNLASWPPISMIVSTDGSSSTAARAWAEISSSTRSAPMMRPTNFLPAPVDADPSTCHAMPAPAATSAAASSSAWAAVTGLPRVRVYSPTTGTPSRPASTALVLVEPTSMPSQTGMRTPVRIRKRLAEHLDLHGVLPGEPARAVHEPAGAVGGRVVRDARIQGPVIRAPLPTLFGQQRPDAGAEIEGR